MNLQEPGADAGFFARASRTLLYLRIRIGRAMLMPQLSGEEAYDLRQRVIEQGGLSQSYVLMCALSAGIATLGLLQSSTAVVIGAMLVSPLMGPIAALGFGFASFDGKRIRDAARVVLVGAAIGVLTGMLITGLSPIRGATPEILARTVPTLLDLAVALLSGIAGGYATVRGKGEATIGVAIATALMPPLATVGYGIGVMQPMFAFGALLLFLTNLSAIAFAFAVIARLSGAARPMENVDWKPRYIVIGLAAFLVLATPLAMTLVQVTREAGLRSAARAAILDATGSASTSIAQLDVTWPIFGDARVSTVVVSPRYAPNAEETVRASLAAQFEVEPTLSLQQVLAADVEAQTRAMLDAAMERTVAGIAADVPPFARIRASIGLPTHGVWTNRAERVIYVEPFAAPDWTLADYRAAEQRASADTAGWQVNVLPPVSAELQVSLDAQAQQPDAIAPDLAVWAIRRWGMARVTAVSRESLAETGLATALAAGGIRIETLLSPSAEPGIATIRVLAPPPTEVAATGNQ